MRLCNALIQYFLIISLSLFTYNCYGHEHHDHVDPVTTKYSNTAAPVDPLAKSIETANVQKNDFQQHNDDEHLHDTIEARLRSKHHFRQSVHQHTDDDKHETEQDYINRLNSALEDGYKTEQQVPYTVAPIVDTINNLSSQNIKKDDAQIPLHIQKETISSPTTSIPTPPEQKQSASDGLSSTAAPTLIDLSERIPNLDEKSHPKVISDEIVQPVPIKTNDQQWKDPMQQNVVKEDILFIHKETLSSTQPQQQQQDDTLNIAKTITDRILPPSDQQEPISNTIINTILPDNTLVDTKPSPSTPLRSDEPQQRIPDSVQNISSPDLKVDQQPLYETTQNNRFSNPNPEQPKTTDTIQNNSFVDVKYNQQPPPQQQQQVFEPVQTGHSSDVKFNQPPQQQQQVFEPEHAGRSSDVKYSQQPSPQEQQEQQQQQQQQQAFEPVHASHSSNVKLEEQPILNTVQNISELYENLSPATPLKTGQEHEHVNVLHQHQQQQQQIPEPIQNTGSTDHNTSSVQEKQQPETIDTVKPTETTPTQVKSEDILAVPKEPPTFVRTPPPPARVLRSATSKMQQRAQSRHRHGHSEHNEHEKHSDDITVEATLPTPISPTIEQPIQEHNHSIESSSVKPEEPHVEIPQKLSPIDLNITNEIPTEINDQSKKPIDTVNLNITSEIPTETIDQNKKPIDTIDLNITNEIPNETNDQNRKLVDTTDLPRQVHVHDPTAILNELKEEEEAIKTENLSLNQEIENNATVDSFLVNDHSPHLPRILENDDTSSTIDSTILTMTSTAQTIETAAETPFHLAHNDTKTEETNNSSVFKPNISDITSSIKYRQVCWRLPKPFEPTLELIDNQVLRFINILPEFLRTTLFGHIDDRETLMNTMWFTSICIMCFIFSFIFLSLGAKRLKQTKHEKEIRARCQQLQQYNNQIELERATFERQNQKLSDEIDELKNLPVRDVDEEIFEIREKYEQLHADWKIARTEHDALQRDIDYKHSLIQKHEFDMQKQVETVAYLNDEILRQKQELEKERETIAKLQSNDLSLERFEKLQEIIHELKSEITQLKQDKFAQTDQLQQVQQQANQLDVDNNELTIKMKQLRDLLEQRDQTIARIREKMLNDNDDDDDEEEEEKTTEISDLLSTVTQNNSSDNQQQRELLSTIDNDVEKANQHMRDLHSEIEEKTRRIKELDALVNQEKDRCRELETKLKVVLELRERDAHLHIRQLGQTDAELRKARTDTERVRILQQQLELKQQQLDDVQKVLASEQTKFSEECSKLQHETHEKWMEVKRLTRELDGAKKECEGLRRQITKYGANDRSSQEKTMHKPVAQHLNTTGRLSSEPETNGSSPPPLPYQQGENFRPIDRERNDSGAASPAEMFRIRPPVFGLARPPFFPPPFLPPPPNPFMMGPRFPMPVGGPHGMISPIQHLITNGSGGSEANSFEIVDSANITPNSTSYDAQFNGSAVSPTPDDEQQATGKAKKAKKSSKKKTKTSTTTTVSGPKEDV